MTHPLHDPIRHNAWATRHLLAFCQTLDPSLLNATLPGTFGTILETARHIIYEERDLLDRLLDHPLTDLWQERVTDLPRLLAHADQLIADWDRFLTHPVDSDQPLAPPAHEGTLPIPAGIFVAVVLYHGNEHRGQICSILGSLSHEPPELTPWAYGIASGRMQSTAAHEDTPTRAGGSNADHHE